MSQSDEADPEGPVGGETLDHALRAAFRRREPSAPPSVLAEIEKGGAPARPTHVPELAGDLAPVVDPSAPPSVPLGRFQVLGEIASGGMGVVLQGRDASLGRDVAVKVLHERHAKNAALVRRFVAEARIAGQLQHPGIVPVYELGLDAERRPYFAMKLVRGETLASLLAARTSSAQDRGRFLGVFERVCETVGYAHARGVVHRDLKPSNVMVGSFGEVQVVDWGLAKLLRRGGAVDDGHVAAAGDDEWAERAARMAHSLVGSVLGTPAYMAPEQARGEVEELDERSDVFALGAILCEILTGEPPYREAPGRATLDAAAACDLTDARARLEACGADRELVELALACLQREKKERPRNGAAIASALAAYLDAVDERARAAQVAAAEARVREEHERRMRRRTVLLSSALVSALVVGGAAAWWLESDRRARREEAERAAGVALQEASHLAGQGRWSDASAQLARAEVVLATAGVESPVRERARELAAAIARDEATAVEQRAAAERRGRFVARVREIRATETDDASEAEEAYRLAFLDFGLDVDQLAPAEVGARLRALDAETRDAGWLALDDWAWRRARSERRDASWRHLIQCAKEADPDPLRGAIRDAGLTWNAPRLREIAREIDVRALEPQSIDLFAFGLALAGDADTAVGVLEDASRAHPDDFWLHYHLAQFLPRAEGERLDEAREHASIAVALRPRSASARTALSGALRQLGDVEGARREAEQALAIDPANRWARTSLAMLWYDSGDVERALAIGAGDDEPGREGWGALWIGRIAFLRGDFPGLLRAAEFARERGAGDSEVHALLALGLQETGRYADAIRELAQARELASAERESAAEREREEERERERPAAHARDGVPGPRGREHRGFAPGWGAREHDERAERHAAWSAACERMRALEPALEAALAGAPMPESPEDRLALARVAQHRGAFALSARLYDAAFAARAELASSGSWPHAIDAACARARAGFGLGADAGTSTPEERARWRSAALAGLRESQAREPTHPGPPGRGGPRPMWPSAGFSARLAPLRDAAMLAQLDAGEREEWERMWSERDARERVGGPR